MKQKHTYRFHVVVYWDDVESTALLAKTRQAVLESQVDAVCFYSIREHEISLRLEPQELRRRVEHLASVAREWEGNGLETSAALLPCLGWGQVKEEGSFQKITGSDGTRSGTGCCPLDNGLRNYLKSFVRILAENGFQTISLEDDFQTDNHRPVREGCFCPLHMKAFSRKMGASYTRESLVEALRTDEPLRSQWEEFKISVLIELARALLQEAQSICANAQFILLGGSRLGPLVESFPWKAWRPPQGFYAENRFSAVMAPLHGQAQRVVIGEKRRPPCLAEITSWPRNAYAKSWDTMAIQTALSAFLGFDEALFWAGLGYRDGGFAKMLRTKRRWFEAIRQAALDHPVQLGIALPVDADRPRLSQAMMALGRMGFPIQLVSFEQARLQSLIGLFEVERMPDGFPGNGQSVILDLATLRHLGPQLLPEITLKPSDQMFSSERITEDRLNGEVSGLYSTSLTFLKEEDMIEIQSAKPLRVLSHYVNSHSQPVTACVFLDEERRWLIINESAAAWERLISAHKARQLRNAIEHIHGGPLPVQLMGGVDTFVFARENGSGRTVLVINFSFDAIENWQIQMDREVASSGMANESGDWISLQPRQCPVRHSQSVLAPRTATLYRFQMKD